MSSMGAACEAFPGVVAESFGAVAVGVHSLAVVQVALVVVSVAYRAVDAAWAQEALPRSVEAFLVVA